MTTYTPIDERFALNTAEHKMTMLHDSDLYRHVHFRNPASSFYWFDIITWPRNLAISGDMGSFSFSRVTDMFEFFRGHQSNPGYWAEKLTGNYRVQSFSEDRFRQIVSEHVDDYEHDVPGLRDAVRRDVLDDSEIYYEVGAQQALDVFEHDGFRFADTWEWDFREYTAQFLWCCHAIPWAIAQYDTAAVTA